MKYVLDSNVAFKWVVTETDSDKADRIRLDFQNAGHELLSPDIFKVEVAHALTRAERQKRVPVGKAKDLLADIFTTPPHFHPFSPLLARALDISSDMRVGVYDCLYVALAEHESCQLLTADDKLIKKLQSTFPLVIVLSSIP